jgi:phospholipase/lecithinase/hemolysin
MRIFYQNCVTAAIATLLLPIASSAQDPSVKGAPFSGLVVFSGSLSDTGNAASVHGDFPAPYYKNRTTNGLNVIDVLADKFHLSSDPSLHLVGKQGGTNYAVLHASAHGDLPIDLPAQVEAYLVSRNFAADPKALYFIFVGANDIVSATIERDDAKAQEILKNGIAATEAAFRKLYTAGARMFYAPNNVNLGIAPVTKQFGVSERATAFSVKFNRMWEQKMRQLERELDVPIFRFDFFRQIEDFLKVAGTMGFNDVTRPCLALMAQGGCDLERFAFFNELLPTRRIHQLLGDGLAEALMQQLASEECMMEHRCGRRKGSPSYATVKLPEDFE